MPLHDDGLAAAAIRHRAILGSAGRSRSFRHDGRVKVVTVTWQPEANRFEASGTHRDRTILVNAPHEGEPTGFSASELLLAAAGSCSGWDVIEVLHKKRQPVSGVQVEVRGEQPADYPKPFTRITLVYRVTGRGLSRAAVERAVQLSAERYCPVIATVRAVAEVVTEIELLDDDDRRRGGETSEATGQLTSDGARGRG
jgi:putative redox protein